MDDTEARKCETCRWWAEQRTEQRPYPAGVCRRYPPTPITGQLAFQGVTYFEADRAAAVWPITDADDKCGEYTAIHRGDHRRDT